jgi:hypothetical protein
MALDTLRPNWATRTECTRCYTEREPKHSGRAKSTQRGSASNQQSTQRTECTRCYTEREPKHSGRAKSTQRGSASNQQSTQRRKNSTKISTQEEGTQQHHDVVLCESQNHYSSENCTSVHNKPVLTKHIQQDV